MNKWKTGTVNELISPQLVSVDRVPHHVRDLYLFPRALGPVENEKDTTLRDKELCVLITKHEYDHVIEKDLSQSSGDSDNEESH